MTRQELIERIRQHEAQCNQTPEASFLIQEARELADGVIAVVDSEWEFTLYFDNTQHMVHDHTPFEDESEQIANFPDHTGFITNVMAKSWEEITETAKMSLMKLDSNQIDWHEVATSLEF